MLGMEERSRATKSDPKPSTKRGRLGIVLSGGGSRGVAQIGVLRALLENKIEPECVAGVSAGAIVGALYASGYAPAKMLEFFKTINPFRLIHVSFGKPGLLDPIKLVPEFRRYFPADSFEKLDRKLVIAATDLLSGDPTIFESGPLIMPILASSSFPMVFSPVEIGGRWYGDGGIIDNFPVKLLRGSCDVTLGVHVSQVREMTITELSSSLSILERALEVGMISRSRASFAECDLVILPKDLARFGMFDTAHFDEIEVAGYEAAIARMDEVKQLVRG